MTNYDFMTKDQRKRSAAELLHDASVYRRNAASSRQVEGEACKVFGIEDPQEKADRLERQAGRMEREARVMLGAA